MNSPKFLQKLTTVILVIVLLTGCGVPTPAPAIPPSPFKHIQNVPITHDEHFNWGGASSILYIPATDRIVLIMTKKLDQPMTLPTSEVCDAKVVGYAEYTPDMQPTGKYGYLTCGFADLHAMSIGNDVFVAKMRIGGLGYTLEKYDGVTWERLASLDVPWDDETQYGNGGGPDISYINGQIVVTGEYYPGGQHVGATHNMIFTTDLAYVRTILLLPPEVPEHRAEFSLLQLSNSDILLFGSAGSDKGNLEVLHLDQDWHFLEQKWLRDRAFFPTGSVTDGKYVYVAYLDWTQLAQAGQNVGLAAFDDRWNRVADVVLTDVQSMGDYTFGEQAKVVLHGNRLYVSYDIHTSTGLYGEPDFTKSQTYIDVFELSQNP